MLDSQPATDVRAIARRIVTLRRALGYERPADFARFLRIGTNTLGNYETAARRPDLDQATNIVRCTGATLDWLYLGTTAGMPAGLLQRIHEAEDRGGAASRSAS